MIKSIGSDVLEPDENYNFYRFPVTVAIPSRSLLYKGRKLPLLSGMSLSAVIILPPKARHFYFHSTITTFLGQLRKDLLLFILSFT